MHGWSTYGIAVDDKFNDYNDSHTVWGHMACIRKSFPDTRFVKSLIMNQNLNWITILEYLTVTLTFFFVDGWASYCWCLQDPFLRNLESRFALQQKIVEAAKKLANEPELCKTVKKKRRRNCLDAMHKLQLIENEMNQYRIKKGKKPTQRASVIIAGTVPVHHCIQYSATLATDLKMFSFF